MKTKSKHFADVTYVDLAKPDYDNVKNMYLFGQVPGFNSEGPEQHLQTINAYFTTLVCEKRNLLKQRLFELLARIKSIDFHLQRATEVRDTPVKENSPYSILDAFLFTFLGLLFWGADLAILIGTVANGLGMNITFDEIVLSDLSTFDGLLLALAIAATPFILKLWLERYIIAGMYQNDKLADSRFKRLFVLVGTLILSFFVSLGLFRFFFQPLIMDPNEYLLWKVVFTLDGRFAFFGAIFMVVLVLTMLACSSIALTIGLYNLKCMSRHAKSNFLQRWMSFRFGRLLSKKELVQQRLADHPDTIQREIEVLEARRDTIRESFLSGYHSGELRQRRFQQKQAAEKQKSEKERFKNMQLHQYARYLAAENVFQTGQNVTGENGTAASVQN